MGAALLLGMAIGPSAGHDEMVLCVLRATLRDAEVTADLNLIGSVHDRDHVRFHASCECLSIRSDGHGELQVRIDLHELGPGVTPEIRVLTRTGEWTFSTYPLLRVGGEGLTANIQLPLLEALPR